MSREKYIKNIEDNLSLFTHRINLKNLRNKQDLNIIAETIFAKICNLAFGLEFNNANSERTNMPGIDLIDIQNKIVAQVTTQAIKAKIEESLAKIPATYRECSFKFIVLQNAVDSKVKKDKYNNPYNISFNPQKDIWDVKTIINKISDKSIYELKEIDELIEKEVSNATPKMKEDSIFTAIINILAEEEVEEKDKISKEEAFRIMEKINFNELENWADYINDQKVYCGKIGAIYENFDKEGNNTSRSALTKIQKVYIKILNKNQGETSSEIFEKIIESIVDIVRESKNYKEMYVERLEEYVGRLVVDAFTRCKIFKRPETKGE